MKQIATYLSFCAILLSVTSNAQASDLTRNIYINEVMQSTFGGQYDMLNEYPDSWVELYNPSDNQVSLKDYRIGKKKKFSKCYSLPDIKISPKGYVVIYCDKADTIISYNENGIWKKEIHSDFRITTDELSSLYLFDPSQALADTIGIPKMPALNIAFGRYSDGLDSLGWELKPTKGITNEGGLALKILPSPLFMEKSMVTSANKGEELHRLFAYLPKSLRSPKDYYIVRYTLDGTEPTDSSEQMIDEIYFSESTIFKAAIFADSCITPPADTKVLLLNGHTVNLPVVSLCASDEDLNSDAHGIIKNNDTNKEDDRFNWRRPAYFDYFPKYGGITQLSQRCEIRVGGAYTRENKLKTLIVYADERFGTPEYFSAQFWPSNRPEVTKSKSFALRSAGNDFGGSYMRDAATQLVIGPNTDIDWQGFQPSILYINAKYQGIINIRERGNEDNIWAHYDNLEDITLIENNELKEGEYSQFQDFLDFYSGDTHTYQEFDSVMDIEEFMNLMIISSYMVNTDFPGNNNVLWRPMADGGKWRWIIKDVDRSFGIWSTSYDFKYLNWVLRVEPFQDDDWANSEDATRLFRNLMNIDEFKQEFIDRYTVYLGDFLRPNEINSVLTWCHDEMAPEWDYFSKAQGMKSKTSWESEISTMKNWTNSRTPFMRSYLKSFFSLGDELGVTIGIGASDAFSYNISINDISLTNGVFDGSFYNGRNYIIKGDCKDSNYAIVAWDVTTKTTDGKQNTERVMNEILEITPNRSMKNMSITAVKGINGVESTQDDIIRIVKTIYINTQGISSDEPFDGINIIRYIMEDGSSYSEKKLIRK